MSRLKIVLWNIKQAIFRKCSVEIHISEHCNLNCAGCSHYSPLAEHKFCDLKELDSNLRKLSKICDSIGVIRLLGGEPLLNPDVASVFGIVRSHFENVTIKLVTNGLLLVSDKLPSEFWKEAKRYNVVIAFTVYPVSLDYSKVLALCKKHGVRVELYNNTHGRFINFKLSRSKKNSQWHYYICREKECFQLVGNRIFSCPQSAYVGYLNQVFKSDFKLETMDSISIDNISSFKFLLFKLFPRPFCKYCVFPRQKIDWSYSKCSPEEWIEIT